MYVILTVVFIILKVTKKIDWSWWWVFSPFLFQTVVSILFLMTI
jgi:hypothetical protein